LLDLRYAADGPHLIAKESSVVIDDRLLSGQGQSPPRLNAMLFGFTCLVDPLEFVFLSGEKGTLDP
jgi:hypothetical protein